MYIDQLTYRKLKLAPSFEDRLAILLQYARLFVTDVSFADAIVEVTGPLNSATVNGFEVNG